MSQWCYTMIKISNITHADKVFLKYIGKENWKVSWFLSTSRMPHENIRMKLNSLEAKIALPCDNIIFQHN